MTRANYTTAMALKEARALGPLWAACMLTLALSAVTGNEIVTLLAVAAYVTGPLALGAEALGHEYSHRTLAMLLCQPVDRRRILAIKLAVLAAMLLTLTALAWVALPPPAGNRWLLAGFLLPPIAAFVLTPWLTMISGSALGGAVLTVAVPASFMIVGDIVGRWRYGADAAWEVDQFKLAFLARSMIGAAAIGTACSWLTFLRLESVEARGIDIHLPDWPFTSSRAAATRTTRRRRRHPIWTLIVKELRLQQMTFVLVGILVPAAAILLKMTADPSLTFSIAFLYGVLLSLLIGSFASAEERRYGTIEWQMLLPIATWQQWAVKSGTAVLLSVLLSVGLPALIVSLATSGSASGLIRNLRSLPQLAIAAEASIVLTIVALYVSSLSSTGVRALAITLPVIPFGLVTVSILQWMTHVLVVRLLRWSDMRPPARMMVALSAPAIGAGLALMLWWFGLNNHRSAERGPARVWIQALWIVGLMAISLAVFDALSFIDRRR
jgi:hypothetical protein